MVEERFDDRQWGSWTDDQWVSITPTQVLEYLFCPRFVFFEECLMIPEHQELRLKVQLGREVHAKKAKINPDYLRKKIGVVKKERTVYLASRRLKVRGIVDEVLTLRDGTMAPLEYKFAEYSGVLFKTHKTQLALQALLIQENYGREVVRGYLVYTRSKNMLREVPFSEKDFRFARRVVDEVLEIIQTGLFPRRTSTRKKCLDCCYRNICV